MTNYSRVMIIVGTPIEGLQAVLEAIAGAGGGVVGEYTHCSFTSTGIGRFKPSEAANPTLGERHQVNEVTEYRIETFCERAQAKEIVQAIRAAHPYEEPVIYLLPLLDEDAL